MQHSTARCGGANYGDGFDAYDEPGPKPSKKRQLLPLWKGTRDGVGYFWWRDLSGRHALSLSPRTTSGHSEQGGARKTSTCCFVNPR